MNLTVAATPTRNHAVRAATTVNETQLLLGRKMLRSCARQVSQASTGAIQVHVGAQSYIDILISLHLSLHLPHDHREAPNREPRAIRTTDQLC
ncbi:hypothetical protein OKW27_001264 [Paraburkholderia sp. 35.1]